MDGLAPWAGGRHLLGFGAYLSGGELGHGAGGSPCLKFTSDCELALCHPNQELLQCRLEVAGGSGGGARWQPLRPTPEPLEQSGYFIGLPEATRDQRMEEYKERCLRYPARVVASTVRELALLLPVPGRRQCRLLVAAGVGGEAWSQPLCAHPEAARGSGPC